LAWGASLAQQGLPPPADAEFGFGSAFVCLIRVGAPA
jgi:hypothetical protein